MASSDAWSGPAGGSSTFGRSTSREPGGLRPRTSCWAVAALIRSAELGPFPAAESQAVRELVPIAGGAIRSAVLRRDRATAAQAPAMLVIDSDASLVSATPGAADVMAEIATHGVVVDVPTVVMAAARRATNLKNAPHRHRPHQDDPLQVRRHQPRRTRRPIVRRPHPRTSPRGNRAPLNTARTVAEGRLGQYVEIGRSTPSQG